MPIPLNLPSKRRNAGKKPTTKKYLSFWRAFIAISFLFCFSLDSSCSGGAEERKAEESASVPDPAPTTTTPTRKSREKPPSRSGSSAAPSEPTARDLKPQEEEGFRKRRHLKVSISDHEGGNDIDFSDIHQAMAHETSLLRTGKNYAIVWYSIIYRAPHKKELIKKTYPLLIQTSEQFHSPIFVSGTDFDGHYIDGVTASAQSSIHSVRRPQSGFRSRDYAYSLNADEQEFISKFGYSNPRSLFSAENFDSDSVFDFHVPRFLRSESAISSTTVSESLRKFVESYNHLTTSSLRNSGNLIDTMKRETDILSQSHSDSEQTALRILDGKDFEKQVMGNVKLLQETYKTTGKVKIIGVIFHWHSTLWPCNHCAPAIFADNEREDGYAKRIRNRIAGLQHGASPKVLTLMSYDVDWDKSPERGGGAAFTYRGVDSEVNSRDPIDAASFFPFIPLVKVGPSRTQFLSFEAKRFFEVFGDQIAIYLSSISLEPKGRSKGKGPVAATTDRSSDGGGAAPRDGARAGAGDAGRSEMGIAPSTEDPKLVRVKEIVSLLDAHFPAISAASSDDLGKLKDKLEGLIKSYGELDINLEKLIIILQSLSETMDSFPNDQINSLRKILNPLYVEIRDYYRESRSASEGVGASGAAAGGAGTSAVTTGPITLIETPDNIIPLPTPRERNMNRFHAMVQEQGGTGVWREVLEILSSPSRDAESATDSRVSEHLFTPPRPLRRESSEDARPPLTVRTLKPPKRPPLGLAAAAAASGTIRDETGSASDSVDE